MKARTILGIIVAILALLLLYTSWWGFGLKDEKAGLEQTNEKLNTEITELVDLKSDLESEFDSLEIQYEILAMRNDSLQGSLKVAKQRVRNRDSKIKKIQTANKAVENEAGGLRAQIQTLLNTKSLLESSIAGIQAQNDSLRARTGVLEADLSKATEENSALNNLNQTIQDEVGRLTLANFKASAFRVEVEKKKAKVTTKSKRARRIQVSFDLTNVPEEYQGTRPLYLVITDDKATPLKMKNPIRITVAVNGQDTQLIAAESKDVNITQSQRLSFTHDLDSKLGEGYYRAAVYTDIGLLGATSFRLRK